MKVFRAPAISLLFVFCVLLGGTRSQAKQPVVANDLLLTTLQAELERGRAELSKLDPAPYFISYSVADSQSLMVVSAQGGILNSMQGRRRVADVSLRIGTPELDNTDGEQRFSGLTSGQLPLRDDPDAIARVLWKLTYEQYRKAQRAYSEVKTKSAVRAQDEDQSADFSEEKPSTDIDPLHPARFPEQKRWEDLARRFSASFRQDSRVEQSMVVLLGNDNRSYTVSTEGTKVVTQDAIFRVMIQAETRADDGMQLMRVETFQFSDPAKMPTEAEIATIAKKMTDDLEALRNAPLAEPYSGPALLSGRAAAVFFHEVLGHRVEGQRQRGRDEGQTFAKKINEKVMPEFLSVTDDPTLRSLGGRELSGWYRYDDEGIPASRVEVVKDGVLKNFLMGRMPVKNFSHSNGHGRSQAGMMPVGRQANLIVTSSKQCRTRNCGRALSKKSRSRASPTVSTLKTFRAGSR